MDAILTPEYKMGLECLDDGYLRLGTSMGLESLDFKFFDF
jgi:hypothetical protein